MTQHGVDVETEGVSGFDRQGLGVGGIGERALVAPDVVVGDVLENTLDTGTC